MVSYTRQYVHVLKVLRVGSVPQGALKLIPKKKKSRSAVSRKSHSFQSQLAAGQVAATLGW